MFKTITFNINGVSTTQNVDVRLSLLEMLRVNLELTGQKQGCGVGECGACTVIVDGEPIDSCCFLAVWVDGKSVLTIEGITNEDGTLNDVQQNFVDSGAIQCGFCTPGLIVSTTSLLEKNQNPTRDEIRRGLSGNLCRCTGYTKIIDAVEKTIASRKKN